MKSDEELLGAMFDARLKKTEQLEGEVDELKALLKRAYSLVAQATNLIEESPAWDRRAEEFLHDLMVRRLS